MNKLNDIFKADGYAPYNVAHNIQCYVEDPVHFDENHGASWREIRTAVESHSDWKTHSFLCSLNDELLMRKVFQFLCNTHSCLKSK